MPPWFLLLLAAGLVLAAPGCGGCRKQQDKPKQEEQKPKEKPKPPIEISRLSTAMAKPPAPDWYKPGHWTELVFEAKTNHADFLGDLQIDAVDVQDNPLGLLGTPYELSSSRPLALPKGQIKQSTMPLYLPLSPTRAWVHCRGQARTSGPDFERREPLNPMPAYQYYLVVLAQRPDRYAYVPNLTSLQAPRDSSGQRSGSPYLRLVQLGPQTRVPLPSQALYWSAIAAVLWDDVLPGSLDPDQRQALIDWLHWGGQLIVSGPDSLDSLHDSFLGPYLPAHAAGQRPLAEADLEPLARLCPIPGNPPRPRRLRPAEPLSGVKLALRGEARFLPNCNELIAERRVGRGRIVVTGFQLGTRTLASWPGVDVLVCRHFLQFPTSRLRAPDAEPEDEDFNPRGPKRVEPVPGETTQLRYLTRDLGSEEGLYLPPDPNVPRDESLPLPFEDEERRGSGVAAWNDFSQMAQAARASLQNAARIEVPDRWFVVLFVAGYLFVLVPLNWLLFRLLGRVEWAWAAAPVIAVVSAALVIHQAQLDIGFVRCQTEIDVVELQPGYSRAHVTRYLGLYTSLTTPYNVHFPKDPGAMVQPLPTVRSPDQFRMLPGQSRLKMHHRRDEDTLASGFLVSSSSTGLLHAEQMLDLGGPIVLDKDATGQWQVTNRTRYRLEQVSVTRKVGGRFLCESAWLDSLSSNGMAAVEFHMVATLTQGQHPSRQRRDASSLTAAHGEQGAMNVRPLTDLVESLDDIAQDEYRLVGLIRDPLPGMVVRPAAAQQRGATVVVAHLRASSATKEDSPLRAGKP